MLRLAHRERIEKTLIQAKVPLNIKQIATLCGISYIAVARRLSEMPQVEYVKSEKDTFTNVNYSLYRWNADAESSKHKLTANYRKQLDKKIREVSKNLDAKNRNQLEEAVFIFEKFGLL